MQKLTQADFDKTAAAFAASAAERRSQKAAAFATILANIETAMKQARTLTETWPPSEKGITELSNLVRTAETGFGRIANEVIAEEVAAQEALSGDADPSSEASTT